MGTFVENTLDSDSESESDLKTVINALSNQKNPEIGKNLLKQHEFKSYSESDSNNEKENDKDYDYNFDSDSDNDNDNDDDDDDDDENSGGSCVIVSDNDQDENQEQSEDHILDLFRKSKPLFDPKELEKNQSFVVHENSNENLKGNQRNPNQDPQKSKRKSVLPKRRSQNLKEKEMEDVFSGELPSILYGNNICSFSKMLNKQYEEENYDLNILQDEKEQLQEELEEQKSLVSKLIQQRFDLSEKITGFIQEIDKKSKIIGNSETYKLKDCSAKSIQNQILLQEIETTHQQLAEMKVGFLEILSQFRDLQQRLRDKKNVEIMEEFIQNQHKKLEQRIKQITSSKQIDQFNSKIEKSNKYIQERLILEKETLIAKISLTENYISNIQQRGTEEKALAQKHLNEKKARLEIDKKIIEELCSRIHKKEIESKEK